MALFVCAADKIARKKVNMKKILLIDDDPDIITVLQLLLKKKGYEVATASREEEAYDQVSVFQPHLIVLDVLLSGVDGRTICKKLKNSDSSKHIPIIMFSAHPSAQKNMEDFGADDFIPKPFESSKILERIEAQLAKQKQTL
jgi:DNA-binding response OmpR family regulator